MKVSIDYDYEYNVLGIANYKEDTARSSYYKFIELNHSSLDGDIIESGVYRGRSLLATALLLKELGSDKLVYGFDSFSGFPPVYNAYDNIDAFTDLFNDGKISKQHFHAVQKNKQLRDALTESDTDVASISTSGDFSDANRALLEKKIDLLGLDNIILVEGAFEKTMVPSFGPEKIFACMMDNDLYRSHITTFEYVWPKLVTGGMIYLDEYFSLKFPGARIATEHFIKDKAYSLQSYTNSMSDIFERWFLIKTG